MKREVMIVACLMLLVMTGSGQEPGVSVFDTGSRSPEALSGEALAKQEGWVKIAEGKKASVKGSAVLVEPAPSPTLGKTDGAPPAPVSAAAAQTKLSSM